MAFPECRPRRRHRYIQPEPRANNVVKNEADNSKNNSSAAAEEKQEGNEKSGRKNSSSDLDSDSRAALKLMMCCLHWRYCSFYGFHFLRSMLRLARQAKTSLFSQAQTPHPLLDPHPHPFRNIWGSKAPERARVGDSFGCLACLSCLCSCWLHLIPQSEIRKNFN